MKILRGTLYDSNPIFAIEYPACFHDIEKAFTTLGGKENLARMRLSHEIKPIFLKFRPHDPFSHAIPGCKQTMSGLLLRLTQDPCPHADTCTWRSHVLGSISEIYCFRDLADYEYSSSSAPIVSEAVFKSENAEKKPLLVLPPRFHDHFLSLGHNCRFLPHSKVHSKIMSVSYIEFFNLESMV